MSRRKEHLFDEPRFVRPRQAGMRGVRPYKLMEISEPTLGGSGWEQSLGFVSEIAGGGEVKRTIRAKKPDQLKQIISLIQTIEEVEMRATAQYRSGDLAKADFNREMGVRLREKIRTEWMPDLPEREWIWENNQLIYRGQQRMF